MILYAYLLQLVDLQNVCMYVVCYADVRTFILDAKWTSNTKQFLKVCTLNAKNNRILSLKKQSQIIFSTYNLLFSYVSRILQGFDLVRGTRQIEHLCDPVGLTIQQIMLQKNFGLLVFPLVKDGCPNNINEILDIVS